MIIMHLAQPSVLPQQTKIALRIYAGESKDITYESLCMYFNDQTGNIVLCVEKPKNISADHSYRWSQVWYLLCPPTRRKDRIKQQKNNCEHSCNLAKLGKTS